MREQSPHQSLRNAPATPDNPAHPDPTHHEPHPTQLRIAIIGGGPRGLWACEELFALARATNRPIDVTVFNDGDIESGVGATGAYDPHQPEQWLLNVESSTVATAMGTFDEWRRQRGEKSQPGSSKLNQFPPRKLVGEFLSQSWHALFHNLPTGSSLQWRTETVEAVSPQTPPSQRKASPTPQLNSRWQVDGEPYDEVLLVTGHAPRDGGQPGFGVYPPQNVMNIAPESSVLVRGAALTFIDLIRVCPARRFVPVTRSGRFMEVKPNTVPIATDDIIRPAERRIRNAADMEEFQTIVAEAARAIVLRARQAAPGAATRQEEPAGTTSTTSTSTTEALDRQISAVLSGEDLAGDPVADLRASFEVATGKREPSAAWGLGITWRALHGAIVDRASYGRADSLEGFADLEKTLQRVAFGPPPDSAADVLRGIDSGRIDLSHFTESARDLRDVARDAACDVIVDAVLSPGGVVPGTLEAYLVERNWARTRPGTNGLDVSRDGFVLHPGGADAYHHLAAIGRVTDGVVYGNDMITRQFHDIIPRWAAAVFGRTNPGTNPGTNPTPSTPPTPPT